MRRNRQQTEARIRQAALELLQAEGFENWGVNRIAREAGIDKVLLYRYFGSLDGLLAEVVEATTFWPYGEQVPVHSPEAFIDETRRHLGSQPHLVCLLGHPSTRHQVSPIRRKYATDLDQWTTLLKQHTRGYISPGELVLLPAALLAEHITGISHLTSHELWNLVSPPLEWSQDTESNEPDELPTELL